MCCYGAVVHTKAIHPRIKQYVYDLHQVQRVMETILSGSHYNLRHCLTFSSYLQAFSTWAAYVQHSTIIYLPEQTKGSLLFESRILIKPEWLQMHRKVYSKISNGQGSNPMRVYCMAVTSVRMCKASD